MPLSDSNVAARPEAILYTIAEAARVLSLGKDKLYELVASGEIPVVRLGERTLRIPKALLEDWVRSRSTGGGA